MGATGGKVGFVHAAQQFSHLARIQLVEAAHDRMAGDTGKQVIKPVLKGCAGTDLAQVCQDVAHQSDGVLFSGHSRDRGDHQGVAAEGLKLETDSGQLRAETFCNGNLAERKLKGLGKEQALGFNSAGQMLLFQTLVRDPFAGGMLVDDHQLRTGLAEDVFTVELADDCQ